MSDKKSIIYKAHFVLSDGKSVHGFSADSVPITSGQFYLVKATEQLEGSVAAKVSEVVSYCFDPLQ